MGLPSHHVWAYHAISAEGHEPRAFYAPTLAWAYGLAADTFETDDLTYHGTTADHA